jgi:hypothetical protein
MKTCLLVVTIFCSLIAAQEPGARYLIITHDNFYNAILPLAEWKHRKGLRTKVVKLSEIGSTTTQIHDYIQNAYNTWSVRPEYLLFVGAPNYLPFYYYGSGWNGCYSDNYYTNMDSDIFNEILSGRLTVHNTTEAQTVVNKMLLYEKTPDVNDSLWFINACLIVNEDYWTYPPPPYGDDSIYWSDIRHAKNHMLSHGYNTIDTLSDLLGDNSTTVINRVNQGRAFVLYRGVGTNNWDYPFSVDPNQTQNGAKLPIVLSLTCGTLGTGSTSAVAERWLLTGTPTSPRGGAGYYATTTSGYNIAHLRSAVCKGFFNALFQDGKRTFGEACEGGRVNVYNLYNSEDEYRGFTTVGDPAMEIWTAIPRPMQVMHVSELSLSDDSLAIGVAFQEVPIESALVCVQLDTLVYEYGYTDNDGAIVFNFDTLVQGYLHITVTACNKIPYLDSIHVGLTQVEEVAQPEPVGLHFVEISPNPFRHEAQIRFMIHDSRSTIEEANQGRSGSESGTAEYQQPEMKIYDAVGRVAKSFDHVSCIVDHESMFRWDGTDDAGHDLPAGVYFLYVSDATGATTIPVVLLK